MDDRTKASPHLCDCASDLEALVLVAPVGVQILLVPRQLQLLWVQLHHGLLADFDVWDQRLEDNRKSHTHTDEQ